MRQRPKPRKQASAASSSSSTGSVSGASSSSSSGSAGSDGSGHAHVGGSGGSGGGGGSQQLAARKKLYISYNDIDVPAKIALTKISKRTKVLVYGKTEEEEDVLLCSSLKCT